VRNNLAYATHQFFQTRGFLYIHTPIITASDCEGAGEMFAVTTVLPGKDDPSEHEKYLTDKVFNGPVIVYNYPKDIKAFYMKQNEDGKTVQAMDVLVPRIGEVVGGSAREEDLGKLDARIKELDLDVEAYWWYRDLRRYGSVPHAGFGLGFERLVMMATGMENIKDVIPFPRAPG